MKGWAVLAEKDDYSDVEMTDLLVDYINITQLRQQLLDVGWQESHIHELREFDRETLQDDLDWLTENADQDDIVFLYVAAHGRYLRDVLAWPRFFAADWSPDGAQIALICDPDMTHYEVYVMDADGSNPRQLTDHHGQFNSAPDWSPGGTQIAFVSDRTGTDEIYVMSADGANVRRLTRNEAHDWWPALSPDGTQIAFTSNRDGNHEIYVMTADGTNVRRLTHNEAHDWWPAWSPDGSQITFQSDRDGNYEIYVMNTDGTDQRRLTHNDAKDSEPAWRP